MLYTFQPLACMTVCSPLLLHYCTCCSTCQPLACMTVCPALLLYYMPFYTVNLQPAWQSAPLCCYTTCCSTCQPLACMTVCPALLLYYMLFYTVNLQSAWQSAPLCCYTTCCSTCKPPACMTVCSPLLLLDILFYVSRSSLHDSLMLLSAAPLTSILLVSFSPSYLSAPACCSTFLAELRMTKQEHAAPTVPRFPMSSVGPFTVTNGRELYLIPSV